MREIKIIFIDQMMKTNFKYFNYFQVIYFRCQLLYNSNTKFIYHSELVTIRTELLYIWSAGQCISNHSYGIAMVYRIITHREKNLGYVNKCI